MIIILDGNVWEKLVELTERNILSKGTIILEKHLIMDRPILHWVKDLKQYEAVEEARADRK